MAPSRQWRRRGDGVDAVPRRLDAVDAAVRESTRDAIDATHRLLGAQVNGLAVKVILAQVDHFQFPHGTWLTGKALWSHSLLALLSFSVIEGTPSFITEWAPAPLLAMVACLVLAPLLPGVPLLRDVVGEEAFTGGPGALKYAFPSYSMTSSSKALPYACGYYS